MDVPPFRLERWQSRWENRVELNIAESGVEPLSVEELAGDREQLHRILSLPLGYPQTNGSEELRSRIAALYAGARPDNILVTSGCAEANFLTLWCLIEPGDEVVFLQPNYMQVAGLAEAFGARLTPVWLREHLRWAPDIDELCGSVTNKTRVVAVCNPNNPTGSVLGDAEIAAICEAAKRAGAWVLADEVYRGAELDGATTASFWGRGERLLCTGGLSKAYGLPGLRIGWVVGNADVIERLWGHRDYTSISATMLGDRLAALALEPATRTRILARTRKILQRNHRLIHDWVVAHAGSLRYVAPSAGAVAWIGYAGRRPTAELAELLREQRGVLLVPGEHFGMESYLRIGFGGDAAKLRLALDRVGEVLES